MSCMVPRAHSVLDKAWSQLLSVSRDFAENDEYSCLKDSFSELQQRA